MLHANIIDPLNLYVLGMCYLLPKISFERRKHSNRIRDNEKAPKIEAYSGILPNDHGLMKISPPICQMILKLNVFHHNSNQLNEPREQNKSNSRMR